MSWEGQPIPGGWEYIDGESKIVLDFVRPTSRGLEAWVELWHGDDPIPIVQGQQNIMSPRAAVPFLEGAKHVKQDWAGGLREAFNQLIVEHRDPSETVDLTTIEPQPLRWVVEPLIETGGNTRLIAQGGSGKSIMAMALALTVATGSRKFLGLDPGVSGPVLYLDWETNAGTHAQRVKALCEPLGVPLPDRDKMMYQYHAAPLARAAQSIRRTVDRYGAVMVVVDSSKMAAGPSGQSSGEDSTLALYTALREIAKPALIIDHKTKEDVAKGRKGGYGSIYNQNLARMEWEMTKYQRLSKNKRTFVLSLEKENNVGDLPPLGFELYTTGGATGIAEARFARVRADTVTDPDASNLLDRIASLMMSGTEAMSIKKISDMLGDTPQGSVRACLNTNKNTFENVGSGRVGQWRLVDDYGTDEGYQPPIHEVEVPAPVDDEEWSVF